MSDDQVCSVCYMEPEEGASMASCAGGEHSMCPDCAGSFLSSALTSVTQQMLRQWKESKTLPCPHATSDAPCCLAASSFFQLRDPGVAQTMADLSASLTSTIAQQDVMTRMIKTDGGSEEGGAKEGGSEQERLVEHIKGRIDDTCTSCISCPHCQAPFMDFSGCMALTCSACNKEFCGVCLSAKHVDKGAPVTDAHAQVLVCLRKYDAAFLSEYGMRQGDYFISNAGGANWERWKDRIKASKLLAYLFTIKKDVLWRVYDAVEKHLVANQLLNADEVSQLRNKVFSHEANAQHLVRIPVLFALLYASKQDCSFAYALDAANDMMDQPSKMELGRRCVERMREVYPSWQAVRVRVPGETFEAINYPPEALSLITAVIDEWGVRKGFWTGVSTSAAHKASSPSPSTPPKVAAAQAQPNPAPAANNNNEARGGRGNGGGRGGRGYGGERGRGVGRGRGN